MALSDILNIRNIKELLTSKSNSINPIQVSSPIQQPPIQEGYQRPVIPANLESEYMESMTPRTPGRFEKLGLTPENLLKIAGGVTALTGGSGYMASGLAQAGDRLSSQNAQSEQQRQARLIDYVKNMKDEQNIYDRTKMQAEQSRELQQLKNLEDKERFDKEFAFEEKKQKEQMDLEKRKLDLRSQEIAEKLSKDAQGKQLPATQAVSLADAQSSVEMLDNMAKKIPKIEGLDIGPIGSMAQALNPYSKSGQQFKQLVASTKQVIGKGLEGGVLRKEDESKYDKIIPRVGDTKEILQVKYDQLRDLLINKYKNTKDSLGKAGYNVSNFDNGFSDSISIFGNNNSQNKIGGYTIIGEE